MQKANQTDLFGKKVFNPPKFKKGDIVKDKDGVIGVIEKVSTVIEPHKDGAPYPEYLVSMDTGVNRDYKDEDLELSDCHCEETLRDIQNGIAQIPKGQDTLLYPWTCNHKEIGYIICAKRKKKTQIYQLIEL